MQSISVKNQIFQFFPKLPRELRDSIWRECLPCRVVEIDFPNPYQSLNVPLDDDDSDCANQAQPSTHCFMYNTSNNNAAPPIVSRVCRESRQVAFETGRLIDHLLRTSHGDSIRSRRASKEKWFDKARDVVYLYWNGCHYANSAGWSNHATRDRLTILELPAVAAARVGYSVTLLLFQHRDYVAPWPEGRAVLERMGCVRVCLETVCIHLDIGPAVASGLFGRLGEEPVVLVDDLDYERLARFWALWDAHREEHPDPLTFDFFSECHAQHGGSKPQRRRTQTIRKTMEDVQTQWVLDNWEEQDELRRWPAWEQVWLAAPDRVATRDPAKKQDEENCRDYMRKWVPNRDHPWVMQVYSRMPELRPVIMFRLCTDKYQLEKSEGERNPLLGRWEELWGIRRRESNLPP